MAPTTQSRPGSLRRWLTLAVVLALLFVASSAFRFWRSTIPTPTTAFYTPPDPLPSGAPGSLIRSEPLPDALPAGAQAWRILYLSTGLNGEPIAVSGVGHDAREESAVLVIGWLQDRFAGRPTGSNCAA